MIYLDTCIVIYAVEDQGETGNLTRSALTATNQNVAMSALTLHECLVAPLKSGDFGLRDRYLELYDSVIQVPISPEAYIRAAELRALFGVKTPDALHLCAAEMAGCTEFWTRDHRLEAASHGFAVNILDPDRPAERLEERDGSTQGQQPS